jgi:hypothetical protein
MAESFYSHFNTELVEGGIFSSVEQACSEIFSYIKGYYNRVTHLRSILRAAERSV